MRVGSWKGATSRIKSLALHTYDGSHFLAASELEQANTPVIDYRARVRACTLLLSIYREQFSYAALF